MKNLARYILLFSVLFLLFLVLPAFLWNNCHFNPLVNQGDILDILTPLVLLPIYWLLFWYASSEKVQLTESLVFVLLAGMWAEGQGMHLSANSIGRLLDEITHGNAYILTGFYDENLSHYLWHFGIFSMAVLLVYQEWRRGPGEERLSWELIIPAGIIHGLTLFVIVIEGGTAPIGIPFVVIFPLVILVWRRDKLKTAPITSFYFISFLLALFCIAGWCFYWSGCPEFSDVGIV
jgi:hypothetical protein